ncbi:hypothetical protein [Candidatus Nanohalobium constans]|uniref:Uncharacterized protein n=1 Tax=Candidatus Nanohalobium constans TaxID=2565781 RepID=A0A5Q0UG04_9ARCH|nr:hypothetical protein [Candidatus Nanohalobium constans]QGA80484.1 hypothetical protein LC1Nh_0589 [Candidatus Nanohalobium constans]
MSSIGQNPNIQAGETGYGESLEHLKENADRYDFDYEKIELAARIVEAEYLHENYGEVDKEFEDTFFSQAGSSGFEQILQGAKQEIDEEVYEAGKAYLLLNGSEVIDLGHTEYMEEYGFDRLKPNPAEWFGSEFNDE